MNSGSSQQAIKFAPSSEALDSLEHPLKRVRNETLA